MNRNIITAALIAAAAFAGVAHAQEADVSPLNSHGTSSLQRADVRAQAIAALQAGTIEFGEASIAKAPAKSNLVSRAQIQAEAREATKLGVVGKGEFAREPSASELAAIAAAGLRANTTLMATAAR